MASPQVYLPSDWLHTTYGGLHTFLRNDYIPQQVADDRILGIDFSVPSFYVDSNGDSVSYPHAYRAMERKLAKEQKKLSRKVYGSNNYYKQLLKVQRLHQRVSNIRKDFLHNCS